MCFFRQTINTYYKDPYETIIMEEREFVFMAQMDSWIHRRVLVGFVVLPVGYIHGMEDVFLFKAFTFLIILYNKSRSSNLCVGQTICGASSLNGSEIRRCGVYSFQPGFEVTGFFGINREGIPPPRSQANFEAALEVNIFRGGGGEFWEFLVPFFWGSQTGFVWAWI